MSICSITRRGAISLKDRLEFTFGVETKELSAMATSPELRETQVQTPLGSAPGWVCVSENSGLSMRLIIGKIGDRTLLRLTAENQTERVLHPQKLVLVQADGEGVRLGSGLSDWSLFKNGVRKNDFVCVHNFGDPNFNINDALACGSDDESLELAARAQDSETAGISVQPSGARIGSAYLTVLRSRSTGESLLLGFLTLAEQFGFARLTLDDAHTSLKELLVYTAVDCAIWEPGQTLSSEWLLVDEGETFEAIRRYAADSGRLAGVHTAEKPPTGWCSWYFYFETTSEESVLANARFLRENSLPAQIVQIDMGWEERLGDWYPNHRFPRGMKALTDDLHAMGFKAGLWLSPFWVEPRSEVHCQHSEWLLRDQDGKLVEFFCHIPGYVIDTSIPEACAWIEELAHRVTQDWGFDYIKTDFLRAVSLRTDVSYRYPMTRAQALRRGLEAMRLGAGRETFILGCGGQYGPSVGVLDGNRTSNDISSTWKSVRFTYKKNLLRWWMQPHWGFSDADCLIVRGPDEGIPGFQTGPGRIPTSTFSVADARTIAELYADCGGIVMLGDEMFSLRPEKLAVVRELLSPDGVSATPRDMFLRPLPSVLHKIGKSGETVMLVNWDDAPTTLTHTIGFMTGKLTGRAVLHDESGRDLGSRACGDELSFTLAPHETMRLSVTWE